MRMTPKLVNVNRKTMEAADAIAGRRSGSVTRLNACQRDAPRTRAASSRRGSMCDQTPPTTRSTTA